MSFLYQTAGVLAVLSPTLLGATFNRDVAPIIYKNCGTCHRIGGSAPFSLLSYTDVKRHALQIADVTRRRFMPPWLPDSARGEFIEERRLTDREIETIAEWVKQGTALGSATDAPPPPRFAADWALGKPDLILRVAKPYRLPAGGPEIFWNFVIPVPITAAHWVKAVDIRPGAGAARALHHASIILDRSQAARRHETSSGSGFPGMDLEIEETTFDPDGTFLAWKPGNVPIAEPDGMAWHATPGMDLVFNVHLRPTGKPEIVNPEIGLYFTDKPQSKFPMLVELQRDASIDIPAGDRDYVVADDFRCPMDVKILAVYPHAHYLGKLLEGYATLPDGTRKTLIRIPDWDLSWQGVYHFKEPVTLPRGSVISMRFHYDNSTANVRNPNSPPKRVRGGSRANDEMGNLWLQVLPVEEGDHRAELEEALARQRLEHDPQNYFANFHLGDVLLSRGDAGGSVPYFDAAAKVRPQDALAATQLGVALATASRLPEAVAQFKRALELNPKFTDARFDLASVEAEGGLWQEAASDFKRVLAERPRDARAHQHLGEVLFVWGDQFSKAGQFEQAIARYREALSYRPADAELHMSLGVALARAQRLAEAVPEFQAALRINPNFQPARQALEQVQGRVGKGKQ